MNITSNVFLFLFLPVVLFLYLIVGKRWLRNGLLLMASLFFYAWGEPENILVLFSLAGINYLLAYIQAGTEGRSRKKMLLTGAIVLNLMVLLYYKYLLFFASFFPQPLQGNLNAMAASSLPLGISFFTFKIISYQVDVYREKRLGQYSFLNFLFYVSFFPQVTSGPITRFEPVNDQLHARKVTKEGFAMGTQRIMLGFAKKMIIANQTAIVANAAYSLDGQLTMPMAWLGSLAFTLQLYFDFSGYSDIAIGLGKLFGFETSENFNYPYIATSVQDFWRRWHISLSSWFRDYVYIPLGGNRCPRYRVCINTVVVFALTGLWHGASWTFIVWGLYYAGFLILERVGLNLTLKKLPKPICWIYTFLVINIGWIFFRAETLSQAANYISALIGSTAGGWTQILQNVTLESVTAMLCGMVAAFPVWSGVRAALDKKLPGMSVALTVALFVIAILYMAGGDFSPFLYVQF